MADSGAVVIGIGRLSRRQRWAASSASLFLTVLLFIIPFLLPTGHQPTIEHGELHLFDVALPSSPPPDPPLKPKKAAGGSPPPRPVPLAAVAKVLSDSPAVVPIVAIPPTVFMAPAATLTREGDASISSGTGNGGTGTGSGSGVGAGGASGDSVVRPSWVYKPKSPAVRPYWPNRAIKDRTSGTVLLSCWVIARATQPRSCRTIEETPVGYGFGSAAVHLSRIFRMRAATRNGKPYDSEVEIPIKFNAITLQAGIGS